MKHVHPKIEILIFLYRLFFFKKNPTNNKSGPNGSSLIDIQNKSGATIQISKKGMFAPGTKNRIVTISGAPNGIQLAHFLIEQKVNEEETKRRNQNTLTGIPGIMQ